MVREDSFSELNDHVVICNCNDKVKTIVEELQNGGDLDVVLIVQDRNLWEDNPDWYPDVRNTACSFITMVGCPTDVDILQRAQISRAKAAIILADPNQIGMADAPSTITAIAIEKQNPQVHTVMELILSVNRRHLEATEVNEIVCLGDISEKLIAQSCITPGVKNIFENLLTTDERTPQIFIPELTENLAGSSFRDLSRLAILNEAPFILIGFLKSDSEEPECSKFVINPRIDDDPGKDTPLSIKDKLVVIAYDEPDLERYTI